MDPSTSNGGKSPRSYALSGKIMLSAIVVLFAVVILIFILHLYVRWHVIRRASRRIRRRRQLVFSGEISGPSVPSINGGLDPSIIATLPVMLCSDDDGGSECGECAVCLNEFKQGEKIRCLPRCAHSFHIDCIDMWFDSHSTCPLCRAAVEAAGASDPPPSDPNAAEVRIQIPEAAAEGSSGQQEQMPGIQQPSKPAIIRMVLIRWLYRPAVSGAGPDLERAGGESVRTMAPGSNPDR